MTNLQELAYALWESRGRPLGDDWADWFAAEAQLRARSTATTATPKLRFDLMADLRAIYADKLAAEGVTVDPSVNTGEVLARYFPLRHRDISNSRRRAKWSRELTVRLASLDAEKQQALAAIESLAKSGGNLNPYQSRQLVTRPGAPDSQLLEWGITHFHLGLKPDKKHPTLIEGTSDLLFVVVRSDALYLVEIFDHKAFADQQVFNIANGNWPELFAHAAWNNAVGLERPVSAQERSMLRRANINVPTLGANGTVYGSVGFGITTAGTPVAVMQQQVFPIIRQVRAFEQWCRDKPGDVLQSVPPGLLVGLTEVTVRLVETANGLLPAVDVPDGVASDPPLV